MKIQNILYSFCVVGLLSTTSCKDFLDEDPRSNITLNTYYKDVSQARENVNSLYRTGAPVRYGSAPSAYIGPTASVNTFITGYFSNSYEGQELVTLYARELTRQQNLRIVSNYMNGIWADSYRAIGIANSALKYIPGIAMQDENVRKSLIAEARFFRAFNYFYLIKTFGDVPLITEPYENLENMFVPRNSVADIYALIESDLKEAVDVLPGTRFTQNGFRITKYAAAMALANVYLQQGKFADAATYAKIVTASSHSLTPNDNLSMGSAFNKLRTTDDLPEVIYSYEFNATISNSGWWPSYAFNASATAISNKYSIYERVFGPTDRFLNVYAADDLRIQPNQFFHWNYTLPTDPTKTWSSTQAGIWYYYDQEAFVNTGVGTKDWNIYRYAEALLIAAEAIAKSTGVNAEAAGYLAEIKARASTTGKTVAQFTTELQALSVDNFVQECWRERLRELPLEFKMWDDCLRTGMFPVISTTTKGAVTFVPLIGAQNGSGATFKESDLLWPISMDERQRNPELTQNPGYTP